MNRNDPPVDLREPEPVSVRDLDRIREKVTFQVEPRHALLAGVGAVTLLMAAFGIGVLVGRSCDRPEPPLSSGVIEALPPVVRSVPPRDATPPTHRHAVLPLPPPEARGLLDALAADRRGPEEVLVPAVVDDAPWPALAVSDPCAGVSCAVPDGGGCVLLSPLPSWVRVNASGAANSSSQRLRELQFAARKALDATESLFSRWVLLALRSVPASPAATAALFRPPAPARPVPNRAHATPLAPGWFTVQVRSYRDEALARDFAASLRSEGYSVEIARHDDAEGHAWFRVRVGRFPTLGEARDFARRLNERTGDQAIVMAMEAR